MFTRLKDLQQGNLWAATLGQKYAKTLSFISDLDSIFHMPIFWLI
jgi:hypothetical protein